MLTVGLSSTSTSLPRLLRILDATLRELGESGPGEPELARFRGAMRGSLLRRVEPLLGRAEAFNACMLRWDRPDCMDEELRRWESVDADAVRRVLEVHLRPDRRVLLSVVPEGDGGALPGSVPLEAPLSVDAGYFASSTAMASMSR
jgi:predicted Zn-dependent peptidase